MTQTGDVGPDATGVAGVSPVLYAAADGIATLTLNRPERRNAVTLALMGELEEALLRAWSEPGVRVVVLTGAGGDFCVGRDNAGGNAQRVVQGESREEDAVRLRRVSRVLELLVDMPKPTIAAVRGGCAGGGLSFALACDLRISADTAVYNSAFVAVGFPGDLALPWMLTRVVGTAQARRLMLLPGKFPAGEALDVGIVTEVVPEEGLDERVGALARRLADSAPLAIRGARRNLEAARHQPLPEYLGGEVERLIEAAYSPDAEEARQAFLQKRPPRYPSIAGDAGEPARPGGRGRARDTGTNDKERHA